MPEIALVTCRELPSLDADDQRLVSALAARGVEAKPVVWNDASTDWNRWACAVVRSTWDYHLHLEAFLDWAERAGKETALFNPAPVLRWNVHKRYLVELAEQAIPIVDTEVVTRGARPGALGEVLARRGWKDVFIKPAVSIDAQGARRVRPGEEGEAHLQSVLSGSDALVQPFVARLGEYGEHSLIFVQDALTHAVRRQPGVLSVRGGTDIVAADDEQGLAGAVLAAAHRLVGPDPFLYARVDLTRDEAGAARLIELELVEPSLFLQNSEAAASALADAIVARNP
jgi:hypothetical protein